ncbi:MAG: HAMP domain-containing sensor histidine kinase [Hyphomicrobiaceae bacterium]
MDQKVEHSAGTGSETPRPARFVWRGMRSRVRDLGLPGKLLILTTLFVMLAEILIFVPSIANYRVNWLTDRLRSAQLASLAADVSPEGVVPKALRDELLRTAQVRAVALKRNEQRQLILAADPMPAVDATYDLSFTGPSSGISPSQRLAQVWDAMEVLFSKGDRTLRVIGHPREGAGVMIEVVLPEAPLRAAMIKFGLNILVLSIIISMITAALVYFALNALLVRPMMRLAANMQRFSQRPEDASRIITPSARKDEIGTAERELAQMQSELHQLLNQRSRLAALGLAVSKINHDLRNLLANTQLHSDRLVSSPDPTVQSFAPKLIASLDRAIAFCNDTLRFGRVEEAAPRREMFRLRPLAEEVGDGLGLSHATRVVMVVGIEDDLLIDADRDQLYRVLSNLARNSLQAIEAQRADSPGTISIAARRHMKTTLIRLSDTGPGVPERARAHLFQAFQGSVRKGGTGLGLTIARELVVAHGGELRLAEGTASGAVFEIEIPDRGPTE